jgi:metal-dependent amidase/aminoacylase/carboxypeptidase family protein
MNMAALLGASELLKAARSQWSGTLITLFQPDEEETGGAQAMIESSLYDKIPVPDVLLGQHVTPLPAGYVAIKPGPVLVAADSVNVRVIRGPCAQADPNPQWCVDPIPLAMGIVSSLQDHVRKSIDSADDATVACWGFHAGVPGNDYVAYADFLLDGKTIQSHVRQKVLTLIEEKGP